MNFGKFSRKKKRKQIHSKSIKLANFASSTLIKVIVLAVVVAGVVSISLGIGTLKALVDSSPSIDNLLSNIRPKGYTTFIYDLQGNPVQELHGKDANRVYVELDQIPKYLGNCFIAIEDARFPYHKGVDLESLIRAFVTNITAGRIKEGASTITQQIIKNNVLSNEVTIERKVQEMYLAIELEKHKSKDEILELYMNTAACGKGTYGVQTASRLYFNKDVWDISLAEAAVLASITNRPTDYDPVIHPEKNRQRATKILRYLLEQGYITQQEHDVALAEDVYSKIQIRSQELGQKSDYTYFVDETIDQVVKDLVIQKGLTETQAYDLVYRGGLSIYITQDTKMQKVMDDIFTNEENFPPEYEDYAIKLKYSLSLNKEKSKTGEAINFYHEEQFKNKEKVDEYLNQIRQEHGFTEADVDNKTIYETILLIPQPQAAMVVLDYHNGYVKALYGGRGPKIGNQTFNRATQALRQPGSTFKIVAAYVPAIDARGYTLATVIDDAPWRVKTGGSSYSPGNWYSGYKGLSTVREGIVHSMNILAVKTVHDIGPDISLEYLHNLGFSSLVDNQVINGKTYTDKTLVLPLGGLTKGVSALELTAAYGAVANKGVYVEPIFYTKIIDHDGNLLLDKVPVSRPVMKETTSYLLTDAMVDVISVGTGTSCRFKKVKMPTAGKTGTTTATKDLWFAGYTPYYAAAVWMGYDDPQRMAYVRGYHKYIWRDVMEAIHVDLPYKQFPVPEGITTAAICTESGKLAAPDLCALDPRGSTVRYEKFAVGTVPTDTCDVHKEVLICTSSGLFANEYCPEETTRSKVMIQRPEPIDTTIYSEAILKAVADHKYEIPYSMEGEYCNVHGPNSVFPTFPTDNPEPGEQPENQPNPNPNPTESESTNSEN